MNRCIPTSMLVRYQMESRIFGPFWKKMTRDFVFLHHINPFEIWKWSQWFFFSFPIVWNFGNLPFGFWNLCWVCPRIGPVIVELGSLFFFGSQYKKHSYNFFFFFSFKQFDFRNEVLSRTLGGLVCGLSFLIIL